MTSLQRLIALLVVWAAFAFVGLYSVGSSLFMPSTSVALLIVIEVVAVLFATWLITRIRSTHRARIALSMVGLLLMVSVGCVPATTQPSAQPTPSPSNLLATATAPLASATSEALIPAGWATQSSGQQCRYSISYPSDMQMTDQGVSSQLISFTLANPDAGARNFVYVSEIDEEIQSIGDEGVYNYDPTEAETLLNMQVGESKSVREVLDLAQWFTYQRLPDMPIGGHAAQTYENIQPWEFPGGTKEIRYYLSLNGCTYLVGGYLDTTTSNLPGAITEELFDQIIATIRLGS